MKPRHAYRLAERRRAAAQRCGVPLTEWLALDREQRRALLQAAKRAATPAKEPR